MANDTAVVHGRITTSPNVMARKPVVKGTRFPVERILRRLEENDLADLVAAFPELTEDDVCACIAYARGASVYFFGANSVLIEACVRRQPVFSRLIKFSPVTLVPGDGGRTPQSDQRSRPAR